MNFKFKLIDRRFATGGPRESTEWFYRIRYAVVLIEYSGRNKEQIGVRECLLSLGAESFVFLFAIQKHKD